MPLTVDVITSISNTPSANVETTINTVSTDLTTAVSFSADDKYVPFRLAQLNAVTDAQLTPSFRQTSSIYVDGNGTTSFRMTLQQVKEMNTKIMTVNSLSDDTSKLSVDDYIYLKQD